jgi:peptidoglycan-associated lipoprotein
VRTFIDRSILATMIIGLLFVAACAKRPVATVREAPPAPAPAPPPAAPPPAPAPAAPPPPPPVVAAPQPPPPPPPPRPAPPKEYMANDNLKAIHFEFDKSNIRPADTKILDASAKWLAANPNQLLLIEGHCDERGTEAYNLALGDRRAKAAMNYLVAQGVQSDRITIVSFGEERPMCRDKNEACWSQNRRDMFMVKEK